MTVPCDWNPARSAPASVVLVPLNDGRIAPLDEREGCKGRAVVSAAHKDRRLNLCEDCLKLPEFADGDRWPVARGGVW